MVDIDLLLESNGLFRTVYPDGRNFCWRLLTLKEYNTFRGLRQAGVLTGIGLHYQVFKRCYVGGGALSETLPLGMYCSIGETIMWMSGDCETETIKNDINTVRHFFQDASVNEQMKRVIWTAFPSYTIEDVEGLTRPELIRRFTIAEAILIWRTNGEYVPLDLEDINFHGDGPQQPVDDVSIDIINFDAENEAMTANTNHWDREDAENELAEKKRLDTQRKIAEAMDKLRHRR